MLMMAQACWAPLTGGAPAVDFEPTGFGVTMYSGSAVSSINVTVNGLDGEELIALVGLSGARTINVPSDWTAVTDDIKHSGSDFHFRILRRRLTAGLETAAFTISGGTLAYWGASVMRIKGAHATPLSVAAVTAEALTLNPQSPAITPAHTGCIVLPMLVTQYGQITVDGGFPSGVEATHRWHRTTGGSAFGDSSNGVCWYTHPTATDTGIHQWGPLTITGRRVLRATLAIRPAA